MTCTDEHWKLQPVRGKLERNDVHVWRGHFQPIFSFDEETAEVLSDEEIRRAQGFVRQIDRDRYVFSHLLLRKILAAYLSCDPQELKFDTTGYGKPFIEAPGGSPGLSFSLSHSLDMTLIAVAGGTEVGVDVEYMRPVSDIHEIVNRFFSAHEKSLLNSLPPADFGEAFFAYWASKEAFLKGIGKGLSYPLDKFSVRFSGTEILFGRISIDGEPPPAQPWNIFRISPWPNYSGALAIEAPGIQPEFFEYPGH